MIDLFKNRKIVIATMHKKEDVIKPLLEKSLGLKCIILKNFNTDKFWTFTRDISRTGDMLEAARSKINAAMEISWCDLWIASEWSFGVHPSIPFIQSNLELILFIDKKNKLEIRWHYQSSKTNIDGKYVKTFEEALSFAKECWFPEHGIIVRRKKEWKTFLYKNVNTEFDFKKIVKNLLKIPFTSKVYIETDMRAHKNPTRMEIIKNSTINLIKNIKSICPKCDSPGFVITDIEKWLPCKLCGSKTDMPTFEIYTCNKCEYRKKDKITKYGDFVDPWECNYCNP